MIRLRLLMLAIVAFALLPRAAIASSNPAKIYLADENASSILTFNADGSPSGPNFSVAVPPRDVAIDASGDFWIVSGKKGGGRLAKYNADGTRCLCGLDFRGVYSRRPVFPSASSLSVTMAVGSTR